MSDQSSDFGFRLMTLIHGLRDLISPRKHVLEEVGIEPGFTVLDYGCGGGSYIKGAARMVGGSGKLYALDILPMAMEIVKRRVKKAGLTNVETIQSDCKTGLEGGSVDVVLLYDILHHLEEAQQIFEELNRVLKPGGILSLSDHHMKEEDIVTKVEGSGLFTKAKKGEKTITFNKAEKEV